MKFYVQFRIDNAQFVGSVRDVEIASVLEDVARHVEDGHVAGKVRDENGNTIGTYGIDFFPEEE